MIFVVCDSCSLNGCLCGYLDSGELVELVESQVGFVETSLLADFTNLSTGCLALSFGVC